MTNFETLCRLGGFKFWRKKRALRSAVKGIPLKETLAQDFLLFSFISLLTPNGGSDCPFSVIFNEFSSGLSTTKHHKDLLLYLLLFSKKLNISTIYTSHCMHYL
jgi:hypothetical protein